jgi:hypothetical protein
LRKSSRVAVGVAAAVGLGLSGTGERFSGGRYGRPIVPRNAC